MEIENIDCFRTLFADIENNTNVTEDDVFHRLKRIENEALLLKIPTIVFLGMLMTVGIPGNALVIYVYRYRLPRTTPRLLIITLACFDFFNCIFGMPFEIINIRYDYFLDVPVLCKVFRFNNTVCTCGSIITLLFISLDRFRKICRAFRVQIVYRQAKICVAIIVSVAFLGAIPAPVFYGKETHEVYGVVTSDCSLDDSLRNTIYPKVYLIFLGVLCIQSIIVLTLLYSCIVLRIVQQRKRHTSLTSGGGTLPRNCNQREATAKKTRPCVDCFAHEKLAGSLTRSLNSKQATFVKRSKMTWMMLMVTVVFILGYLPHISIQITRTIRKGFLESLHCNPAGLIVITLFLRSYFLNSAVNPMIYGFYNQTFRQECRTLLAKLLICCKKLNKESPKTDNTVMSTSDS